MKRRAYTLIEILVVISITAVLFLVGFSGFRDYSRRQAVLGLAKQTQADLRFAQAQAIEGKKVTGCPTPLDAYEFYVDTVTPEQDYKIRALCGGTTTVNVKTVVLPSGLTIATANTGSPLNQVYNPVQFKALAQGTNIAANQSVFIRITQTVTGRSNDVLVTDGGYVTIDENYTVNTPIPPPTPSLTLTPTATPIPTITPSPTPGCVDTVCYQDLDGDGYTGASSSVCVPNSDCTKNTLDNYNKNLGTRDCEITVLGYATDTHAAPAVNGNHCDWGTGAVGTTNFSVNASCSYSGRSSSSQADYDCAGFSCGGNTCNQCCANNPVTCYSFSGTCAVNSGNCYIRGGNSSRHTNCTWSGCNCTGSGSSATCYGNGSSCNWSW